jgi:hypothetical protein
MRALHHSPGGLGRRHRTGRHRLAELHQALEARLATLNPAIALADSAAALPRTPEPERVRRPRNLAGHAAQFAMVVLVAAFLAALIVIRGDGMADGDRGRQSAVAASLVVERDGIGRAVIDLDAPGALLRVDIAPEVRGANTWFWCFDAEPPLQAHERSCASGSDADPLSSAISIERAVAMRDATRTYYVQTYCLSLCTWRLEATPLVSAASSTQRTPQGAD